jgi:hypothetical protein
MLKKLPNNPARKEHAFTPALRAAARAPNIRD